MEQQPKKIRIPKDIEINFDDDFMTALNKDTIFSGDNDGDFCGIVDDDSSMDVSPF